jgi:hypothetical protein
VVRVCRCSRHKCKRSVANKPIKQETAAMCRQSVATTGVRRRTAVCASVSGWNEVRLLHRTCATCGLSNALSLHATVSSVHVSHTVVTTRRFRTCSVFCVTRGKTHPQHTDRACATEPSRPADISCLTLPRACQFIIHEPTCQLPFYQRSILTHHQRKVQFATVSTDSLLRLVQSVTI